MLRPSCDLSLPRTASGRWRLCSIAGHLLIAVATVSACTESHEAEQNLPDAGFVPIGDAAVDGAAPESCESGAFAEPKVLQWEDGSEFAPNYMSVNGDGTQILYYDRVVINSRFRSVCRQADIVSHGDGHLTLKNARPLPGLEDAECMDPDVDASGTRLAFVRIPPASQAYMYLATWDDKAQQWDNVRRIDEITSFDEANTSEWKPRWGGDGSYLFFQRTNYQSNPAHQLYGALWDGAQGAFLQAAPLRKLNEEDAGAVLEPVTEGAASEFYFAKNRTQDGAFTGWDIYRTVLGENGFGPSEPVSEVNTDGTQGQEFTPDITQDGKILFFRRVSGPPGADTVAIMYARACD